MFSAHSTKHKTRQKKTKERNNAIKIKAKTSFCYTMNVFFDFTFDGITSLSLLTSCVQARSQVSQTYQNSNVQVDKTYEGDQS